MGLILDTSVIVRAERRGHSVAEILGQIREEYGETEIGVSVAGAQLVGVPVRSPS